MPSSPALGSLAIQSPSTTSQLVHVSPSTCNDLSLFKDLLKEYRKLDDSVTMRLNRTDAQFRDRDRASLSGKGSIHDQACAYLWKDLVENWKRRTEIVEYCVSVVDQSLDRNRQTIQSEGTDPATQRRIQAQIYSDEVKRTQVHNELAVEKILRQRSLDVFRARCRYFTPPLSDAEARKWWDAAQSSQ